MFVTLSFPPLWVWVHVNRMMDQTCSSLLVKLATFKMFTKFELSGYWSHTHPVIEQKSQSHFSLTCPSNDMQAEIFITFMSLSHSNIKVLQKNEVSFKEIMHDKYEGKKM